MKASDMPFEMSMRCDVFLSQSLSRALFFLHTTSAAAAAAFALGGGGLVPFRRSFFFLSLSLSLPPWSNRTRVPLLTECSRM